MARGVLDVEAAFLADEVGVQRRVVDRLAGEVRLQVALRDVGHVGGAVDQDVVPGPVTRRPGQGLAVVPVVAGLTGRVDVDDDPPVLEKLVPDRLSDAESGARNAHDLDPPLLQRLQETPPECPAASTRHLAMDRTVARP